MITRVIVDFDNVIVDTVKAYCNLYNKLYADRPGFKPANPDGVWRYDMRDECPLVSNPGDLFDNPDFYVGVPFYDGATRRVLELMASRYNVVISTIGTRANLHAKGWWIEENLPFISDVMYQCKGKYTGKDIINMAKAVFIDDHTANLESSNAPVKICFGRCGEWNSDWTGIRLYNWAVMDDLKG